MLVGGNPNVSLPRQKYLDALTRSGQPTHFAVRLAELAFGDDVLRASTVTGGKRGTLQLDPTVIDAIQSMIDEIIARLSKQMSLFIPLLMRHLKKFHTDGVAPRGRTPI